MIWHPLIIDLREQQHRSAKGLEKIGAAIGNSVPPETAEALVRANMVN